MAPFSGPRGTLATLGRAVIVATTAGGLLWQEQSFKSAPVSRNCRVAVASAERAAFTMSEPFRPYEKLVEITMYGKKFHVPERNSLLRCFQFISPETIPYGRFCWNQECQYCRVSCQLPDDDEPREMLSCKFIVMAGMEITELSQELKWCLRAKLPSDAPVSQ
jgi:hypothetical protein